MTRKEAAAKLGISVDLLDAERSAGRLAYIQRKPGSKVWITDEAIAEYPARATRQARPGRNLERRERPIGGGPDRRNEFSQMRREQSLFSVLFEVIVVFFATAAAFVWGRETAQIERGGEAVGGEYLLLLLPVIYYTGKRIILDWIADIRKMLEESSHD